jgi:hypothetical protein
MNDILYIDHRCILSPLGASFQADLPDIGWRTIGHQLARVHGSLGFILGDWLNFGVKRYGKKYVLATDLTTFSYQALADFAWVCSGVEISRRREKLSFNHHREVASCSPADQIKWLTLAEAATMSVADLRHAMRPQLSAGAGALTFMPRTWAMEFVRWFHGAVPDDDVERLPSQQRLALKAELKPIVEIYEKL